MYSLAHYFDSSLVQTVGEFAWSSVGGFYDFDAVQYMLTASIQMRNIWMIALLWKLVHALLGEIKRGRCTSVNPARVGLLSFRSGWIGFVSWLTTFALMRAISFRNTAVVSVQVLSRHIPIESFRPMPVYRNYVDYGPPFDLKCTLIAVVVAVAVGWLVKIAVQVASRRGTSLFWSSSHYIPLSAGRLWPWSVLDGVWALQLRDGTARVHTDPDALNILSSAQVAPSRLDATAACATCSFRASVFHWRAAQGCPLHDALSDVPRRSRAAWSVVQLTNLAAMTDPLALFRLRVVGTPLFVYRVRGDLLLLPTPPPRATHARRYATWTTQADQHAMAFVAAVDSRDVPWRALLLCG